MRCALGEMWSFSTISLQLFNIPFLCSPQLQDRESMVTLLVGARYGVSQVINHKLSIHSILTDFASITRIELLPESDKVSLVKIYLQDIKVRPGTSCDTDNIWAGHCQHQ